MILKRDIHIAKQRVGRIVLGLTRTELVAVLRELEIVDRVVVRDKIEILWRLREAFVEVENSMRESEPPHPSLPFVEDEEDEVLPPIPAHREEP